MKERIRKREAILCIGCLFILILLEFVLHRKVVFMMDDLWYGTNLATGEKLKNFGDIIESQAWHYDNWGGRSITHGVLQLTLMSGELCADVLNLLMTLLLAWMICRMSGEKNLIGFFGAFSMLAAFNANLKMSMFWQAGAVNYVYSTVWIFLFVQVYIRLLEDAPFTGRKSLRNLSGKEKSISVIRGVFLSLLGFIAGWSNENMGPASFVLSVSVLFCQYKIYNRKPSLSHLLASAACLLGSAVMILAPGNFVRKDIVEPKSLSQTVYDRFFSMLEAGGEFLFPVVSVMAALLLFYSIALKKKPGIKIWVLLGYAVLSYGAMVLSPHYPDRATFGTMAVCILIIVELTGKIVREKDSYAKLFFPCYMSVWFFAACRILTEIGS